MCRPAAAGLSSWRDGIRLKRSIFSVCLFCCCSPHHVPRASQPESVFFGGWAEGMGRQCPFSTLCVPPATEGLAPAPWLLT